MDDYVKNEYISSNISYRKLAIKHGVSISTLTKTAWREDWVALRCLFRVEFESKLKQENINKKVEIVSSSYKEIMVETDINLNLLYELVSKGIQNGNMTAYELKSYTSTLKKLCKMRDESINKFHYVLVEEK